MILNGIALQELRISIDKPPESSGSSMTSRRLALAGHCKVLLSLMYIIDRVQCRRGKALSMSRSQCTSAVYIVGSVGGGGCRDSHQCQNILTIAGGHSPSRKSPPTKVLPLHIIEIPTKPLIPTL